MIATSVVTAKDTNQASLKSNRSFSTRTYVNRLNAASYKRVLSTCNTMSVVK